MEYTQENIEKLASNIVDAMDFDDLTQYVYDDLVALMEHCKDTFDMNAEQFEEE